VKKMIDLGRTCDDFKSRRISHGSGANPVQYDGLGNKINWRRLVQDASLKDVSHYLGTFDSYARTKAMAFLMIASSAQRCVQIFLDSGNVCDAPWPFRPYLAAALRCALAEVALIDILGPAEQIFYSALPDLILIWRG